MGFLSTPTIKNNLNAISPPTKVTFLKSNTLGGGANVYNFVLTSGSASEGDVYSNNSSTFTVIKDGYDPISGFLICTLTTGSGPSASGTLAKVSGSGSSSILFSGVNYDTFQTLSTTRYIRVRMIGGGGGGGGTSTGGNGGNTFFVGPSHLTGYSNVIALGGSGGAIGSGNGGAGGTAGSLNNYASTGISLAGGKGSCGNGASSGISGAGASSVFGGGGGNSIGSGSPTSGGTNTGAGGGGGSNVSTAGGGGGSGNYMEFYIVPTTTPATITIQPYYGFIIGAGGSAGTGGATGGSGLIIVEEFS